MRITKQQLRQIIREELNKKSLNEGILDIIPYFKKKREEKQRAHEKSINDAREEGLSIVKSLYDTTVKALDNSKYDDSREQRIKALNKMVWVLCAGEDNDSQPQWGKWKSQAGMEYITTQWGEADLVQDFAKVRDLKKKF